MFRNEIKICKMSILNKAHVLDSEMLGDGVIMS